MLFTIRYKGKQGVLLSGLVEGDTLAEGEAVARAWVDQQRSQGFGEGVRFVAIEPAILAGPEILKGRASTVTPVESAPVKPTHLEQRARQEARGRVRGAEPADESEPDAGARVGA